jgi:glyoxylase I family protein
VTVEAVFRREYGDAAEEAVQDAFTVAAQLSSLIDVTDISGWAHVTLSVGDINRSVAWYGEVLGFTVAATETTPQWRRTLCLHPESGVMLVLQQHLSSSGDAFDERRVGLDHLAFRVDTHHQLLTWRQRFQALRVGFTPITSTGRGGLVLTFRDPDGIALELFHRPPDPS